MTKHALLSASSAHRWINCPPSAKLSESFKDEPSTYAQEGTDCHELCAYLVEKALGRKAKNPTKHLAYYNKEMQLCAEDYRDFVIEQLEEAKKLCKDPVVYIEQRLDFSNWVKDGFGTGDCVIVADNVLHIIDYKHGMGVAVSAEENYQLYCYALGALDTFDGIYDISEIKMSIFQPRRSNIDTSSISKEKLLKWADEVLVPTAKLAYDGNGDFKVGSHCQFCKSKAICRKRAEYNLELAKYDFAMPDTLNDTEIAAILPVIDQLVSWGNEIKDYALQRALQGTKFDGMKIVESRSNRKYTDESAVALAVENAGYDPFEKKLLSITAMTSLLGKKQFEAILGELIYKPQGKPALVPESDKRPEMNNPNNDFKDNQGGN